MSHYHFIDQHRLRYPVLRLCQVLGIAPSRYYAWQAAPAAGLWVARAGCWATMPEELITTALQRALLAQQPALGLLVHSDRGGQYCGNAYRVLLHRY